MALSATALCTVARAKYAFGGTLGSANVTFNAAEDTTIEEIIEATSLAATRYCNRFFDSRTWDEVYLPNSNSLLLRNYPLSAMTYLRSSPTPVIEIQNTNSVTNQYATVEIISTGLRLIRQASSVTTTTTAALDWATSVTIDALVTAINAIGSSWTARAISPYGLFPSADLYISSIIQPPYNARANYAKLYLHTETEANYNVNQLLGTINYRPDQAQEIYANKRDDCFHGSTYLYWPRGSLRAKYVAGYTTIPDDLAEMCAQWTAAWMRQTKRDPGTLNTFSSTTGDSYDRVFALCPPGAKMILDTYKRRRI